MGQQSSETRDVDVHGLDSKIGEATVERQFPVDSEVSSVSTKSGSVKSLLVGGTGQGTTSALKTEAWDFFQWGSKRDKGITVVDALGIGEIGLRETPKFPIPDSILLLPDTGEEVELPYRLQDSQFSTATFTIPVSDIPKSSLIPYLTHDLGAGASRNVRKEYERLEQDSSNWSLDDLQGRLTENEGASGVEPRLKQLMEAKYISDDADETALTANSLELDGDSYVSVAYHAVDSTAQQLLIAGYILDQFDDPSTDNTTLLLLRDLWEVAPGKNHESLNQQVKFMQECIRDQLMMLLRKSRHYDLHVIADTQSVRDIGPLYEMFNRYVVFNAPAYDVESIFQSTCNDHHRSFYNTLSSDVGEASIVGEFELAHRHKNIEFLGPVSYSEPSFR